MGKRARQRTRLGFTLLEMQIAFVLLGIGVAGAVPLLVIQLKLSRRLARANPQEGESVLVGQATYLSPDATYFLVPAVNANSYATRWQRKLGAPAALQSSTPDAPLATPPSSPYSGQVNTVQLLGPVDRYAPVDDRVTVQVSVTPVE